MIKKIISLIVIIICLYFLLRKIDFKNIKDIFLKVNWFLVFIYFLVGSINFFIKTYRWKTILSHFKDIKFVSLLEVLGSSQLLSFIFPFRAGDIIQIISLSAKENISKLIVLSSIVWYQLMDIILVLIISFYVLGYTIMSKFLVLRRSIIFGGILLILFLLFTKKILKIIKSYFPHLKEKLDLLQIALKEFTSFKSILQVVVLSILMFVISYYSTYILFKGFNINISSLGIIAFLSVPCLVVLVPISPGHWGTWDLVAFSILRVFNVNKETALSCVFIIHFITTLQVGLFGIWGLIKNLDSIKFNIKKNK